MLRAKSVLPQLPDEGEPEKIPEAGQAKPADVINLAARRAVSDLLILRARWLEAITFDGRFTATERLIATGAMWGYLNRDPEHRRFGCFWMSAARLAADLTVHERTVQRVLHRLPMLGYCEIVEPGGGRHKPGVYRPKLLVAPEETTAPAPTFDRETSAPAPIFDRETSAPGPTFDRETSALGSLNVSARIPEMSAPALTNSVKRYNNPVVKRESGAPGARARATAFGRALQACLRDRRSKQGDVRYERWFIQEDVRVAFHDDEGIVEIEAPTKFTQKYIRDHFEQQLVAVAESMLSRGARVEFTVRP